MKNLFLIIKHGPILLLTMFLASCACFQPATRNTPACAVVNGIVDCTEAVVMSNITQFEPVILQLIAESQGATGAVNWTQVETGLGAMGIKDGGCVLADIEAEYVPGAVPSPAPTLAPAIAALHQSYHTEFTAYRTKKWPGVKFKVKKADGTIVVI